MGNWEFNVSDDSAVEQELTQRDQFNNDDVGIADALVREVIQNSSDASCREEPVKVRFAIRDLDGAEAATLSEMFADLRPHLEACAVDPTALDAGSSRILVIEDFNTSGLTGRVDALDDGNFRNFWRRHGKSVKAGSSGGRWGLGKLVYSSSSKIRAFFGLTRREGEHSSLLMGQAVLGNHTVGETRHPPHGFWFGTRADGSRLQLPVTDPREIEGFSALAGIVRMDQTGLSIAIPYLIDGVTEPSIVRSVVSNYYFPVLSGDLAVEVGSTAIDRKTFHEVVSGLGGSGSDVPFDFVEEISRHESDGPTWNAVKPLGSRSLDETFFSDDDRKAMKEAFARGGLVRTRVPVVLKRKNGGDCSGYIDLCLQALPEGRKPYALFARGAITLPAERRYFYGAPAYGALIASEDNVSAFLGDAENPAHTAWNASAEKLTKNWRRAGSTLSSIRHSLRLFYGLVGEQEESRDPDALLDFFSLVDQSQSPEGKKKRTAPPRPDPEPREKAITIRARKGGFDVVSGPAAAKWTFPQHIRVRVAYDMIGANPFRRHSRFDFDLTADDLEVNTQNATLLALAPNVLKLTAESPEFRLEVRGFDEKRDLVVDARAA